MIRPYEEKDLPRILEMYEQQNVPYHFPDLRDPIFFDIQVRENEQGTVEMAYAARLTAEIYFWLDPKAGTPEERWAKLKELQRAGENAVAAKGIIDTHCWPPPEMDKRFGKRLVQLGWVKEAWPCYSKILVGGE